MSEINSSPQVKQKTFEKVKNLPPFVLKAGAAVAAGSLAFGALKAGIWPQIDWFDGGKSDVAPRGDSFYEGQEVQTVSNDFVYEIGRGRAVVAVEAKQNHDKAGGFFNGDWQSTNGTSFVSDPDDHDRPAKLEVEMRYCADGQITQTTISDSKGEVQRSATFDVGDIFVCDAILRHTESNDAAFRQDDTPTDFHGRFVNFVADAVETQAQAAPCPTQELDQFRSAEYNTHAKEIIADKLGLNPEEVTVKSGQITKSDSQTISKLEQKLNSFAHFQNPDNPDEILSDFSFGYLLGSGQSLKDACYTEISQTDIDTINNLQFDELEN